MWKEMEQNVISAKDLFCRHLLFVFANMKDVFVVFLVQHPPN